MTNRLFNVRRTLFLTKEENLVSSICNVIAVSCSLLFISWYCISHLAGKKCQPLKQLMKIGTARLVPHWRNLDFWSVSSSFSSSCTNANLLILYLYQLQCSKLEFKRDFRVGHRLRNLFIQDEWMTNLTSQCGSNLFICVLYKALVTKVLQF